MSCSISSSRSVRGGLALGGDDALSPASEGPIIVKGVDDCALQGSVTKIRLTTRQTKTKNLLHSRNLRRLKIVVFIVPPMVRNRVLRSSSSEIGVNYFNPTELGEKRLKLNRSAT